MPTVTAVRGHATGYTPTIVSSALDDTGALALNAGQRADLVSMLANHYRLAELTADAAVQDAEAMGAGWQHMTYLRALHREARGLSERYCREARAAVAP